MEFVFNLVLFQQILVSKTYLQLEPIGLVFVFFFALILVIQFSAMLFHRFGTISHILASTELNLFSKKVFFCLIIEKNTFSPLSSVARRWTLSWSETRGGRGAVSSRHAEINRIRWWRFWRKRRQETHHYEYRTTSTTKGSHRNSGRGVYETIPQNERKWWR